MYKRTYINPKIKLINSTYPYIGYYLWLKSRQWVIKDLEGNQFMIDSMISEDWFTLLPNEFYVGEELINKYSYLDRINGMRLQYLNFETFIFEVDGSCLFRDLLYNINKASEFAQSNRFLFSILDEDARFKSENYHISTEYKGVKEWEDQFDKYIATIKNDPIVDHNRVEMPYSISSKFWVMLNHNTLIDLLSFLKYEAPFFYEIYGKQILSEVKIIDENKLEHTIAPQIAQYLIKSVKSEDLKEYTKRIDDTVVMNINMSLILYSQFIRQTDTIISGFYNLLLHKDSKEFKHKVFKGGSTFMVHFVADETKVNRTISNRLCAFAMSSDDGPTSWNYFIKRFLPENLSPNKFMEMLPCKFRNNHLINCRFYDDVKYRNEGKEISNCKCPLVDLSLESAKAKKIRDNNKIGDAYYELTNYLRNGGLKYKYTGFHWDSTIEAYTSEPISKELDQSIQYWLDAVEKVKFDSDTGKPDDDLMQELQQYREYARGSDYTCIMKGYAIDYVKRAFISNGIRSFIINFGGDIYGHNTESLVGIEDSNIELQLKGYFSVFTSGNTDKRGNHIIGGRTGFKNTVILNWKNPSYVDNQLADGICTKYFAGEEIAEKTIKLLKTLNHAKITIINFDDKGKIINKTYLASPFFDDYQIKIRDKIQSYFKNAFRPDLTESSKLYDSNHDELAEEVVKDNLKGIEYSEFLVFPLKTDDLGTLFEVGRALALNKPIIKYDNNKLTFLFNETEYEISNSSYLFNCANKSEVVSMGYISKFINKSNIYYELKGEKDNIMLSVNYNHIELDNGKYKRIIRNASERDS